MERGPEGGARDHVNYKGLRCLMANRTLARGLRGMSGTRGT